MDIINSYMYDEIISAIMDVKGTPLNMLFLLIQISNQYPPSLFKGLN
jgi:hypothetical protein